MTASPRVRFLVAGVQKGGTTALFSYLDDLGSVQMAPVKEIHFFDDETGVDWSRPDYGPLHAAFPWRMEYARGWESEPFAWCIREGRARVDSPEAPGFHRIYSYVERGFYARQLEQLFGIFPREQVLLLSSDALKADPTATLTRICNFVGIAPPAGTVQHRRELVAKDIDYGQTITDADVAYLRGIYAQDARRFAMLSELPAWNWLGGDETR